MQTDAWITIAVVIGMVLTMARNVAGPDMVLMAGLTLLVALGVVELQTAFVGFSNPAVLTVGALFVVARGMHQTGALDVVARRVLGQPQSLAAAQLRLMLPVSGMSAFLNNTPVVAMMVPIVNDWSRRTGIASSSLLMPLSYAAIMGGTCALIGTSTNLVVAGMAVSRDPSLVFGMFEIAWLGIPTVAVGTLWVVIASPRLLKGRQPGEMARQSARQYTAAMFVESGSEVVGRSIEAAGLRSLPGLFLVEIQRGGGVMPAVGPETVIQEQDTLIFAGVVESVMDLRKIRGLVPVAHEGERLRQQPGRRLVEAVISRESQLEGRGVRDIGFRTAYQAAILAVHRQGEVIAGKVGDIILQPGDVLLLETHPGFTRAHRNDTDFALLSEVEDSAKPRHDRAWVATLILIAMVLANATGFVPLIVAALLAAGLMLVCRCLSGQEARRALDLRVLMAMAAAIGIGAAMEQSGAAAGLGALIVGAATPFGPVGLLAAVYIATALLAGIVSTTAAAALMFPVAAAATAGTIPIIPMSYVLMIAASTAFSTPIGYQTNLMVYGPGGYRFMDFIRMGLPAQVITGAVAVIVASSVWL